MSLWGRWDDEIPPTLLAELQVAYLRRQRFEARLQAVALVTALGEALGGKPSANTQNGIVRGNSGRQYQVITPDAALSLCR